MRRTWGCSDVLRATMLSVRAKRCDIVESCNLVSEEENLTEMVIATANEMVIAIADMKTNHRSERIDLA